MYLGAEGLDPYILSDVDAGKVGVQTDNSTRTVRDSSDKPVPEGFE